MLRHHAKPERPSVRTIRISIQINESFKGILNCATNDIILVSEFRADTLLPTTEVPKELHQKVMIRSIPKGRDCDFELATLHILLTTLKSSLLLEDNQGGKYVFCSCSSSHAVIYRQCDIGEGNVLPSLIHHDSRELTAKMSRISNTIESRESDSRGIVNDNLAWLHSLKKSEGIEYSSCDIKESYQHCIETSDPDPKLLVTQIITKTLVNQNDGIDIDQMHKIFSEFYLDMSCLQAMLQNPDRDNLVLLRIIQVQSLMRLQFLAMDKLAFQKFHKNLRRKRKRKAKVNVDVITDVISILEKASFLISLDTLLGDFLAETIPEFLYRSIPEDIGKVFTFFECPNPYLDDSSRQSVNTTKTTTKREVTSAITTTSPLMEGKKKELTSGLDDDTKISAVTIPLPNDEINLHSMPLVSHTRRRKNPLILDAKGYYVGSHFNTRLANADAHYRKVPANGGSRHLHHDQGKNVTKCHSHSSEGKLVTSQRQSHRIYRMGTSDEVHPSTSMNNCSQPGSQLVLETPVKKNAIEKNACSYSWNNKIPSSGRLFLNDKETTISGIENNKVPAREVPFLPRPKVLSTVLKESGPSLSIESQEFRNSQTSSSSQARILAQKALSASRRTIRRYDEAT
jgi:hypothetical protein